MLVARGLVNLVHQTRLYGIMVDYFGIGVFGHFEGAFLSRSSQLHYHDVLNLLHDYGDGKRMAQLKAPVRVPISGWSPIMTAANIREAIERLSATIATQPDKARAKNAPATARVTERLQCEVSGPHGERLTTDMPPAMGGTASGPSPGWLLRGALASCTATVIAMRAAKLGVNLSSLEVTVESDSDNRGILGLDQSVSAGLGAVRTRVKIGAPSASADELRNIVNWADTHSPVACTIRQSCACSLEVDVL